MINYEIFDKCLEKELNNFKLVLCVIERIGEILQHSNTLCKVKDYEDDIVAVSISEISGDLVNIKDLQMRLLHRYSDEDGNVNFSEDHEEDESDLFNLSDLSDDDDDVDVEGVSDKEDFE